MLRPQYTRRPFELMLIGPVFCGKQTLAKELLQCRQVFFQINTTTKIPQIELDRTDYILIMVDMTNGSSLELLKEAINKITPKYLTNHVAVIISKVDIPEQWDISKKDIQIILEPFPEIQQLYVNLENLLEKKTITEQIARLVQLSTNQFEKVDIDYVRSHELYRL